MEKSPRLGKIRLGDRDLERTRVLRLGVKGVPPYKGHRAGRVVWCDLYFYKEKLRRRLEAAGYVVFPVRGGIPSTKTDEARAVLPPNSEHRTPLYPSGKIVWHGIPSSSLRGLLGARGKENTIVLTPGSGNFYGVGVYGSLTYADSYAKKKRHNAISIYVPAEKAGLVRSVDDDNWVLFKEQTLFIEPVALMKRVFRDGETQTVLYTVLKESRRTGVLYSRPAPAGEEPKMLIKEGIISPRRVQRLGRVLTPSKANLFTRMIGLGVGVGLYLLGRLKASPQHMWLGKFLVNFKKGKEIAASPEVSRRGLDNLNWGASRRLTKEHVIDGFRASMWLVRPESYENLFWMVGSFTALRVIDETGTVWWYGEDVYDFHPQLGQGVAIQRLSGLVWSFSEKITPGQSRFFKFLKRLLRDKAGRWIRKVGDKYLPSNDLWNRLGGKPFTTVVACRMDKSQPEIPAKHLGAFRALYREWIKCL